MVTTESTRMKVRKKAEQQEKKGLSFAIEWRGKKVNVICDFEWNPEKK